MDNPFLEIEARNRSLQSDFSRSGSPQEFADIIVPVISGAANRLGVSPYLLAAQFGLETGWGRSVIPGTNNLGNIKDFSGSGVAATDNMTGSRDRYRVYENVEQFANDYVNLIKKRYPGVIGAGDDPVKFARALKAGGYAEDPNYVNKVANAYQMVAAEPNPFLEIEFRNARGRKTTDAQQLEKPKEYVSYDDFIAQAKSGQQANTLSDAAIAKRWLSLYGDMTPPSTKRTTGEAITDTLKSAAVGVGNVLEGFGTLYGLASQDMNNGLRELGETTSNYWRESRSAGLKERERQRKQKIDQAQTEPGKFGTAILETIKDPALLTTIFAENLAMLVPGSAAGRAGSAATTALGASKAASNLVSTASAVGSMAVLQGADIASNAYRDALSLPQELWEKNSSYLSLAEQIGSQQAKESMARDMALKSGVYAALLSAGVNALPGMQQVERLVSGTLQGTGRGIVRGAVGGALREATTEAIEEGGGRAFQNLAVQGVDPTRMLSQGVGEAAGLGAIGGGPFGAIAGGVAGAIPAVDTSSKPTPTPAKTPEAVTAEALSKVQAAPTVDDAIVEAARGALADVPSEVNQAIAGNVPVIPKLAGLLPSPSIEITPQGQAITPEQAQIIQNQEVAKRIERPDLGLTPDVIKAQEARQASQEPTAMQLALQRAVERAQARSDTQTSPAAQQAQEAAVAQEIAPVPAVQETAVAPPPVSPTTAAPAATPLVVSPAPAAVAQPAPQAAGRQAPIPAPQPGQTGSIRPYVESLIKRKATAKELGYERTFNAAMQKARDAMAGGQVNPKTFENYAKVFKRDEVAAAALRGIASELSNVGSRPVPTVDAGANEAATSKLNSLPQPTEAQKNGGVGFKEAFGSLAGGGTTEALYKGLFDALRKGKNTYAGIKDPVLARAKNAFDAGLIKTPDDIRRFEQAGYPTIPSRIAQTTQEARPESRVTESQVPDTAKTTELGDAEVAPTRETETPVNPVAAAQVESAAALKEAASAMKDMAQAVKTMAESVNAKPAETPTTPTTQDRGETKYSRAFTRHISRNQESIFRNDEIALGYPSRKNSVVDYLVFDGKDVAQHEARGERVPKSKSVGFATLDVGETGKIYAINNIFINNDKRQNGYAEKFVRAILATNNDGDRLRINSILPESMSFWEKMGVHNLEQGVFLENGEITRGSYERSRTRLEDGSGSSRLVFSRRGGDTIPADDAGGRRTSGLGFDQRTQSIALADLKALTDRLSQGYANLPNINVLERPSQAPSELYSKIVADGVENSVEAAFHNGEIYAFASNLANEERAEHVVFTHELTHYGLGNVLGNQLNPILNGIYARNPEVRRQANDLRQRLGLESNIAAVEEVLADMPDSQLVRLKGIDRLISAIRDWLSNHGFTNLAGKLDAMLVNRVGEQVAADAMLGDIIRAARDFSRNGPPARGQTVYMGADTKYTEISRFSNRSTDMEYQLDQVAKYAETLGYEVGSFNRSGLSSSRYLTLQYDIIKDQYGDKQDFKELRIRFSDHDLPLSYKNMYGDADFEVSPTTRMDANSGTWVDAIKWLADKANKPYPPIVKSIETKANKEIARKITSAKRFNVLDAESKLNSLNEAVSLGEMSGHKSNSSGNWRIDRNGNIFMILGKFPGESFSQDAAIAKARKMLEDKLDAARAQLSSTKYSVSLPDFIQNGSPDLKSAASKIETYAPRQTIVDKVKAMAPNWQMRLKQGMVDAYAPLKDLSHKAYIQARMSKSADAVLEGTLMYGKPMMDKDGAIVGDLDGKGFLGVMRDLKGEHDRFFMWIAGNRAERLMSEGREHLFNAGEINALKALIQGTMEDGTPRSQAYLKAFKDFRDYNKSVMDIAEATGLIDGAARHLWEHDFYVPFYRSMEDDKLSGPSKIKGLVRQEAFKKLKGGQENLGDLMQNTLRNWSHLISASLSNQAAVSALKAAEKVRIANKVPAGTKGATFAMENGKQVYYEVSDPFVMEAISAMESTAFKGLPMKVMSTFKRYLTLGVTASPTFRIRNLMRDTISAIGQNDISYNALNNLVEGFKGTDKKSAEYAQMLFGGGIMRFGTYIEDNRAEHVKNLINAGVDDGTILTNQQKTKAALSKLWDSWQDFGDRMENVNRAALYKQYRAQGKSHAEASFAARDMLDFSMQGAWPAVRFLTQVVPFMNARMQGLYKLGRAAAEDPKRLGYVVGAVSLASMALMLAYQDDDDWKKREDWDRDAFWWFKIGDVAYRIPKPFEIGAMGTLAERSLELMISDEMTGKRFGQRMMSMLGDTFALNPVPQLFKPMIDIYANEDSFTNRQIETRGMENLSKSERYNASTSLVARALGSAGDVTGLSPIQIDHIIRGYFGWLGSHAAMTVDLMAQPFSEKTKPARTLQDMFVVGDFAKDLPARQSRYLEDFYKQAKIVSEAMADIKQAREAGDIERAQELMESSKEKIAMARIYSQAERKIGEINKNIRITQNMPLDAQAKRERLDQLIAIRNQLARSVSEANLSRQQR